jgi:hypothetical protein
MVFDVERVDLSTSLSSVRMVFVRTATRYVSTMRLCLNTVVTVGGEQSNHCRATAAARYGFWRVFACICAIL